MSYVICPGCKKESAVARILPKYLFRESGLPNMVLVDGVTETTCERCGAKYIVIHKEWQLLQVIATELFMKAGFLTGHEMRFLRGACQMSQAELAKAIHRRRETIAEREAKRDPRLSLAEEVLLRMVLLRAFRAHLDRDENFLGDAHRKRLDDFTSAFLDVTQLVFPAATHSRSNRLTARMLDEWQLEWLDSAA